MLFCDLPDARKVVGARPRILSLRWWTRRQMNCNHVASSTPQRPQALLEEPLAPRFFSVSRFWTVVGLIEAVAASTN